MAPVSLKLTRTTESHVILSATGHTDRNLILRSAAYDIVQTSLVIPAQEARAVFQEQKKAKENKIGSAAISKRSAVNPDTSSGQWAVGSILAQARVVQTTREEKRSTVEAQKGKTAAKKVDSSRKRTTEYSRLIVSIKAHGLTNEAFAEHDADQLKLVYQYLGGKPTKMRSKGKPSFIIVLKDLQLLKDIARAAGPQPAPQPAAEQEAHPVAPQQQT